MSIKRIKRQESPIDAPPQARTKEAKNSIGIKRTTKNQATNGLSARNKVIAAVALVTMLITATAILAQRGKQKTPRVQNHAEQVQNASPAGDVSPESLTSPSLWSKEYIHGPGGKIIATEERLIFTDVAEGTDFYDDIYRIAARGVTVGCASNPPKFCPDDPVRRDQMSAFIMRALGEFNPPTPATQRFNDVPISGPSANVFAPFIERMWALGITVGCGGGNYCPGQVIPHEQMATFIMRARGEFDPPTPPTQRFNDVPPSNVFYNFIERMGYFDIWHGQGCPLGSGNYCPAAPVTRRQMAHILVRAFGI